jgi:mRNA export factor
VYSGGCDNAVREWQLGGNQPPDGVSQQIGQHDAPVKAVKYIKSSRVVVSASWDKTLKFWDCRQSNPVCVLSMPERVYDMDVNDNLLVVATAGRQVVCYDVSGTPREIQQERRDSPLRYQTRCVSCFVDSMGYAIGSIEGRVGIHYVQKVQGKDNFAFKCHRQDSNVYAVNKICFNKQFGTFATCG